ncbi:ABC transporter substrate-binding protein [Subsaximicrobium wynnwilliamsii]|uniref:ABC transporter substrate-binding protein n=1 Tax=Subsaximicrobium wynnwilliamsii TaxID=291179 RepID=A0A5C6ZE56_9FLAO|nr:two-component regulator propeller domain-containing protein [Subsaximicrobium wynnwilliamsii]TXD82183.1 ABC transporter substrate-binding protein [Subsaximicrobium wynnwilliamsii]TXD87823.1 ABC transporter substrate-binding protein [Subsaximicrobium wynnwilliamsii]TXE01773.1 ABC transporter substrate-binding protein [Subsaximicrobium wynnwilliamsii]
MIKKIAVTFLVLISIQVKAQDFSSLWEGYFSYSEIRAIASGDDKIYAAAENAIFSYDVLSNEIQTITTIEGLSGETISTLYYSEAFDLLLIGYETGLMEVYSQNDASILSVVDILEKQTISPSRKIINHFNEVDGLVYISTDYGISVYDLNLLQFGDTYFIGTGGAQININQTTVANGFIYAACGQNNGVRKAALSNPNLIDFQQWTSIASGSFGAIVTVQNQIYTQRLDNTILKIVSDNLSPLTTYLSSPLDVKSVEEYLLVTLNNQVFVYDSNFNLLANAVPNAQFDAKFTVASLNDDELFIGTKAFGVLKTSLAAPFDYVSIKPEGPSSNKGFKIEAGDNELWLSYGEYTISYNPGPFNSRGLSHLRDGVWRNIPFDSLLGARNLSDIAINPFKPSQVFVSSFQDGLLEINSEVPTILYNRTNSGLESLVLPNSPNFVSIRVSDLKFDRSGLLWTLTSLVDRPLKSYDPATGQWRGFDFTELIPSSVNNELGFGDLDVGNNGTVWVASYRNGVIGYDTNTSEINKVSSEEQNMPSPTVRAVALDNRGQLWIGTDFGLRVLFNTSGFVNDPNPRVSEIVILEDGIPTELLSEQFISDIKVDGSNNKWVGTLDSGVFYFSPDGQETIYQFTTDNSPLPSNAISDISIDGQSGRVYIATSRGLVSFSSGGTKPQETLEDAYVYPNPVRPEYDILGYDDLNNINNGIKISGLTESVNIKITDIEGNLVAEAQSQINKRSSRASYNFAIDGGTGIWNGKNLRGNIVATGVYLILISDLESFETKVLKVLIVR